MTILEVCIDTPAAIAVAALGGADRIEVCAALALGGLTPSSGLVAAAVASGVPVMAMIRPRPGGFDYDDAALAVMADDIDRVAALGVAGIVVGALAGAALDAGALEMLIARARAAGGRRGRAVQTTLHRAIDLCADPLAAVEQAVALGFDHVLSSGGAPTAVEGADMLRAMRRIAAGRCAIVAGAGVTPDNVRALVATTGVAAVHASCTVARAADAAAAALGFGSGEARIDLDRVFALKSRLVAAL